VFHLSLVVLVTITGNGAGAKAVEESSRTLGAMLTAGSAFTIRGGLSGAVGTKVFPFTVMQAPALNHTLVVLWNGCHGW
jgi:hypothetical protein